MFQTLFTMIKKIIGWALAMIGALFLFVFIMTIAYGFDSTVQTELVVTSIQTSVIGFFVCAGLSILLLKRQKDCSAKTSWWYKTRRELGYIFIIMFMFSIPRLHHFDIYEMAPRVILLIVAYFLLKPYKNNEIR